MNIYHLRTAGCALLGYLVFLVGAGCDYGNSQSTSLRPSTPGEGNGDQLAVIDPAKGWTKKQLGPGVWLEVEKGGERRRVLVDGMVVLREGDYLLECLLCKRGTKEHESILSTQADARIVHFALIAAKAKPGKVIQYIEKGDKTEIIPPSGNPIKILIRYDKKGKDGKPETVEVNAREWIRNVKKKKDLAHDWVFAGSVFFKDPADKDMKPVYLANPDGAYICISNVPSAMLDLPIYSPKAIDDRIYSANTPKIPPLETKVTLILEPITKKKK